MNNLKENQEMEPEVQKLTDESKGVLDEAKKHSKHVSISSIVPRTDKDVDDVRQRVNAGV